MTGLGRFTNIHAAPIRGLMGCFNIGDEMVSECRSDVYHYRKARFGGVQVMKPLKIYALVMLSLLVLSGCSAQMMAGMDDSEEYRNLAAGDAFLAENKHKEGVEELFSGMQYKVIQDGVGSKPTTGDKVTINYIGKTIGGQVFESSGPFPKTYPVNKFFSGFQMAIVRMKEGAKWEVYLPPELAFGAQSHGPLVGPNSTVVFEIELIKVN